MASDSKRQRTLLQTHRYELTEKHSRFIGIAESCIAETDFKKAKAGLEDEFPDANHITFAYRIRANGACLQRFSDAGEPSGTAGKPILMHIEGQRLINVAIFIVRYFGGIKLGPGGLVKAYGNTARELILSAPLIDYTPMVELILSLPYHEQNRLDYLCRKHAAHIIDRKFSDAISCHIQLPEEERDAFLSSINPFLCQALLSPRSRKLLAKGFDR